MKFAVTIVTPPDYIHSETFRHVAETIHYALLALGHDSIITDKGNIEGRQHIILGCNLLPWFHLDIAPNAILYNTEQIKDNDIWAGTRLIDLYKRYSVWDYSKSNADALLPLGVKVDCILPIGYVKEIEYFTNLPNPDIDVLFIGSVNERRHLVTETMKSIGLNVVSLFGVYGAIRDDYMSRAKIHLNVHYFEAKILEIGRIALALANKCTVLSEPSHDPSYDAEFEGGVAFAKYTELPERALELCNNEAQRKAIAERGYEIIKTHDMIKFMQDALTTLKVDA